MTKKTHTLRIDGSRRDFLRTALSVSLLSGVGAFPGIARVASAAGFAAVNNPILAHIMLDGGPDMRHLFPPAFNTAGGSYGNAYWYARARAHGVAANDTALQARWDNDFFSCDERLDPVRHPGKLRLASRYVATGQGRADLQYAGGYLARPRQSDSQHGTGCT